MSANSERFMGSWLTQKVQVSHRISSGGQIGHRNPRNLGPGSHDDAEVRGDQENFLKARRMFRRMIWSQVSQGFQEIFHGVRKQPNELPRRAQSCRDIREIWLD